MSTESNIQLTLGSLFDGSGGFPLGGLLTGCITPLWSSEVEPFAIRVTTKRLPGMCPPSTAQTCRRWTSSPLAVLARICPLPVNETVWMVHGPACSMKRFAS